MTNLYSELLKAAQFVSEDLYSIPLKFEDLKYILKLLDEDCSYELYDNICNFLEEEYDINIKLDTEH